MTAPGTSKTSLPLDLNPQDDQGFKFRAFISYSHEDSQYAHKLHRKLERYRIPKALKEGGATLGTVFRDKDELSASSGLRKSIKAALSSSENLIVLCTPDAAQSRWVDEEISYFKSLGREDRIFPVILSGEPYAVFNGFNPAQECLPESIRYRLAQDDVLGPDNPDEPLAADFRPRADGEKLGMSKLISGILSIGLDALLQRQLMHARRRFVVLSLGTFLIVSTLTGLTWTAYNAQKEAEARRADAENFVEFLLSDLSLELERYGRLDILDIVGKKAIHYYTQFDEEDFDAKASARRARTFHFMGELQNALAQTQSSQSYFEQAYLMTQAGLLSDSQNPERVFEHTRSAYLRSLPARREGDLKTELFLLQEYSQLAQRLRLLEDGSDRAITEMAQAKMNLGRVRHRLGDTVQAKQNFTDAEVLFKGLMAKGSNVHTMLALSENMAWTAEIYREEGNYPRNYDMRVEQTALLQDGVLRSPDDFRLMEGLVYAKLGLGNAAKYLKHFEEAKLQLNLVLGQTDVALKIEPNREKMRRAKSMVLLSLMEIAVSEDDLQSYKTAGRALASLKDDTLAATGRESKYWDDVLPRALTELDEKFNMRIYESP